MSSSPGSELRLTTLGSGSVGNSALVEAGGACLMIDAGFSADELESRLAEVGKRPRDVDAVVLTHRHRDHVRGATDFCRAHRIRIHATRRTIRSLGSEVWRRAKAFAPGSSFVAAGLTVHSVRVAHDAPETVALVIEAAGHRYGHVTDLGCVDDALRETIVNCSALYLEFNHELDMLWAGDDPPHLKQRIAAATGHLSNATAAELLAAVAHDGLRHVWLGHLSARNNTPALALAHAERAIGDRPAIAAVAPQSEPASVAVPSP